MLVDPLLPLEVPTDWMIVHDDQHRRDSQITPGLDGQQASHEWLKQMVVQLFSSQDHSPLVPIVAVAPLSAPVTWVRRRLVLIDRTWSSQFTTEQVSINGLILSIESTIRSF